jgi:hypothetical protein
MKVKEWDKLSVTFKNDPEKKIKSLILLYPSTIKRKNVSSNTDVLDLTYFKLDGTVEIDVFKDLPKSLKGLVVVDYERNNNYPFIIKEKLLTFRYKLKLWFTTTVGKNLCFKKTKKRN